MTGMEEFHGPAFWPDSPWAMEVLTREDILQAPAYTLPNLLQYAVGLEGFIKSETEMAVGARGLIADKCKTLLILVDDQPVTTVIDGTMQWPSLPVAIPDLERIEIVRGPASALYGADALGGAINLVTQPVARRRSRVQALKGSRGTGRYDTDIAHVFHAGLGVAANLGYMMTENLGDVEVPENREAAVNWDIKDWGDIHHAGYRIDGGSDALAVTHQVAYSWDNAGYNPWPGERRLDRAHRKSIFSNTLLTLPTGGRDTLEVRAGFRNVNQKNERWEGDTYVEDAITEISFGLDADVRCRLHPWKGHRLDAWGAFGYQSARRHNHNPEGLYGYEYSDSLWAGGVWDQMNLWDGSVVMALGGRYDQWSSLRGHFSPAVGLQWDVVDRALSLRALAGLSFRRPDFDQRFNFIEFDDGSWIKGSEVAAPAYDGTIEPGRNLKAETLRSAEGGIVWQPAPSTRSSLTYYHEELHDIICLVPVFETGAIRNRDYQNLEGIVRIHGLESRFRQSIWSWLSVFIQAAVQQGWREYGTQREPYRAMPWYKLDGGVVYDGPVRVDLRGRLRAPVTYNELPNLEVSGYGVLDLAAMRRFGETFFLKVALLNLLDTRYYEYPLYEARSFKIVITGEYNF